MATTPTHVWRMEFNNGEGMVPYTVTKTNTGELKEIIPFVDAAEEEPVALAMDKSEYNSVNFWSTQDSELTLNPDSEVPIVLTLLANKPIQWHSSLASSIEEATGITEDVTNAVFTCPANTTLYLLGLYKATPSP